METQEIEISEVPVVPATQEETQTTEQVPETVNLSEMISQLREQVAKLEASLKATPPAPSPTVRVNNTKYILQSKELNSWGKVPQQQADLAKILGKVMEVGVPMTEADLFGKIVEHGSEYPSIANSKQDPTYLFRYYRGLKRQGNHAGFIARDFIKVA